MTSHDQFPDNFDLSRFEVPSPETSQKLTEALGTLEQFASVDQTRALALGFGSEDPSISVNVYCSQDGGRDGKGNQKTGRSTLNVSVQSGETRYLLNTGYKSFSESDVGKMDEVVNELAKGLPDEEAAWLGRAWTETQVQDEQFVPFSVDSLLSDSPFDVAEYSSFFVRTDFNDGSSIMGNWTVGNDTFMSEYPPDETVQYMSVTGPTGQEYEYRRYGSGKEEILAKITGEQAPREVVIPDVIESDRGNGLMVGIRGDAAFMHGLQTAIEKRREAENLGMLKPAEGSVQDLTAVINAAVASGVKSPEA